MFRRGSHGFQGRVKRLERLHRCPAHPDEWLVCADEALDDTRLGEAERMELDALLERIAGDLLEDTPQYGPCPQCGEPRYCLACNAEAAARRSLLIGLSEPEQARILELVGKAIRDA
jgi:hypothetical protein